MLTEKNGIAVAGTLLVDKINEIGAYPAEGELTKIRRQSLSVGGCVPNVAIDLKTLSKKTPIFAVGNVGEDEEGEFLRAELEGRGIDCAGLTICPERRTSFTEVMSVIGGQRTFFTFAGADAEFGLSNVDFTRLPVKMLHLGYYLLLDKVDNGEGERILRAASERGIKTSIDLVSENSDRYRLVLPSLPFTDNLIINEIEAGKLTGLAPTEENLPAIAEKLMALGVRERVIIHMRECAVCLSARGFIKMPAIEPPDGFIAGKTGAGDAFCAGALIAIHEDLSDEQILSLASAAAIAALSRPDAVSGMTDAESLKTLVKDMKGAKLCW